MSIIFDALKRAEAQAQKGQTPTLASVRLSKVRSKARLWALASLFVLGLSVWWFISTSVKPNDTIASADVVKPSATAGELLSDSVPQANLSSKEIPAELQNPVVATDLSASAALAARPASTSELKAGGGRLSVPSLDMPLTGAAQFDKKPELVVAVAPPVSPPAPPPAKPTPQLPESKPAEAIAPPVSVAEVVPPVVTPPVVTPSPVAPEPALPSVFELDYKLRYELPKMAVSMYVYNAQQQFRFVIIGGKRHAEGELIESKVSITKIRADGLECEFQGTRFFYPRQSL